MADYKKMSKDELVAEAERQGLDTEGTKDDLLGRLSGTERIYVPDASMVDDSLEAQQKAAADQAKLQGRAVNLNPEAEVELQPTGEPAPPAGQA